MGHWVDFLPSNLKKSKHTDNLKNHNTEYISLFITRVPNIRQVVVKLRNYQADMKETHMYNSFDFSVHFLDSVTSV